MQKSSIRLFLLLCAIIPMFMRCDAPFPALPESLSAARKLRSSEVPQGHIQIVVLI
jgi:hypothetical protein